MVRRHQVVEGQLALSDLLKASEGRLVSFPVKPEDIGGELVSILSKGLYTNPLHCIREYVQNAVDADARNVTIKITGNSVVVFDDGSGMSLDELVEARQFGLSPKSHLENVGFRGIGIYSGFDLCRRLRLASKQAGESHVNVLVFDFQGMRQELEAARAGGKKPSLIQLLSDHTAFGRDEVDLPTDQHFTQVDLQDIADVHIRQLSDRVSMRKYLLQNLPVDFAADFEHRQEITRRLREHIPGYAAITITLQSDGLPDELVVKDAIADLRAPSFGYAATSTGQQVAYFWACLNSKRERIEPIAGRPSYAGFVYKIKGFSVGDRERLRSMFEKRPQLYPWYSGEVYVIDTAIIPNAERDDFETNQPKRQLEVAVKDVMKVLEKEAIDFQARAVAESRLERYQKQVETLAAEIEGGGSPDEFAAYSQLDDITTDLQRQKRSLVKDDKEAAEDLLKKAERLQRSLRKEIDSPGDEGVRKSRAAAKHEQQELPIQVVTPNPTVPPKSLRSVLEEADWPLTEESLRLIELLQAVLEDSLSQAQYGSIIRGIEGRLASNGDVGE